MYKLLLCLKYLRSRVIAYFAVAAVALCVGMLVIVISVMNGFLDKLERAGQGLVGDIVVDTSDIRGLAYYDEFIEELIEKVPQVRAASPAINTLGILRVRDHRQGVAVSGIRLPGRAEVSDFGRSLHVQAGLDAPSFDPPLDRVLARIDADRREYRELAEAVVAGRVSEGDSRRRDRMIRQLMVAQDLLGDGRLNIDSARPHQQELAALVAEYRQVDRELMAPAGTEAEDALRARRGELAERIDEIVSETGVQAPQHRMILGAALEALTFRTADGETIRVIGPGYPVTLTIVPLGDGRTSDVQPATERFTVIDDSMTDIWSIDSNTVYIPFETLQRINNMHARHTLDPPGVLPSRCTQINIRVHPAHADGAALEAARDAVEEHWLDFNTRYRTADWPDSVLIQTWRQRHASMIAPLEQQRTLAVIMFGVISFVAVTLIFVIFYMIVFQKTKDIGVLKAVGASSAGVAGIFLSYGAMIGLVGSLLGTIWGTLFVRHINPIRDFCERQFGFGVWSREWFLFREIPNEVAAGTVIGVAVAAIVASVIGAIVPAIHAARMQPVEALRYE